MSNNEHQKRLEEIRNRRMVEMQPKVAEKTQDSQVETPDDLARREYEETMKRSAPTDHANINVEDLIDKAVQKRLGQTVNAPTELFPLGILKIHSYLVNEKKLDPQTAATLMTAHGLYALFDLFGAIAEKLKMFPPKG